MKSISDSDKPKNKAAVALGRLGGKARLKDDLESVLGEVPRLLGAHHHMAHAASCFYPSPFEKAAIPPRQN